MGWLLDTHVWVWSQLEPERLGEQTRRLLLDESEEVVVATISTLEVARLAQSNRLHLGMSVADWAEAACSLLNARTLSLSHAIAAESYALPEPFHRDPADRILVATARLHALNLLTADRRILDYPHVKARNALE